MGRRQLMHRLVVLSIIATTGACASVAPSIPARSSSPSATGRTISSTPRPTSTTPASVGVSPSAASVASIAPVLPDVAVLLAPDRSFRISTSLGWKQRASDDGSLSATIGGTSSTGRRLTLQARRGDHASRITTCRRPADYWETCRRVQARSLHELIAAFDTRLMARQRDIELDGEPAVVLEYQAQERPGNGMQTLVYVLAVHFDRPYAIRIWSSDTIATGRVDDVVDGFQFLAPDPATLDMHFTPDGSAMLQLPGRWIRTGGPEDPHTHLTDGRQRLSVRHGDPDGRVKTCDGTAGSWLPCVDAKVATLDKLVGAVDDASVTPMGRETAAVDGEPAVILRRERDDPSAAVPLAMVLAMHQGRPWVIMLSARQPGVALIGLDEIISGLSFLEPDAT